MFKIKYLDKKAVAFSFLIAGFLTAASGAAGRGSCADAALVDVNSTFRGAAGTEARLALELDSPGIVTLELASSRLEEVDARIGLLSPGCEGFHPSRFARDFLLMEEAATRLAFAVLRPGTYFVGIVSSDPRRSLGDVKLVTRFVETRLRLRTLRSSPPSPVTFLTFPIGVDAVKEEDHEVDPDPFAKSPSFAKIQSREWAALVLSHRLLTKEEDHEVDPDPFLKEEDHEVDPDPFAKDFDRAPDRVIRFAADGAVSPSAAEAWLAGWISGNADGGFRVSAVDPLLEAPMLLQRHLGCVDDEQDDHGDTFACASPLTPGRKVSAELANGWGDDEDVYRFRLGRLATVTVEATGEPAPRIALFDRFGQRIDRAGFTGGRALVALTLAAGEYFVRVSGEGPGVYELAVE